MTITSIIFPVLVAVSLLGASSAGVLTRCDDCFSRPTRLRYGNIVFGGSQYGAFSVSSNGYIVFLTTTSQRIKGYPFNPIRISQARGSPMIAGFWSDINLACPGRRGIVSYTETCNRRVLSNVKCATRDRFFNPTSAIVVRYYRVQRYTCPADRKTNTFTITVATDRRTRRSYVIMEYQRMEWNKATSRSNNPIVGYSNGAGRGRQVRLPRNPAAYLNQRRRLVFRINQRLVQELQMNRGNLALLQGLSEEGAILQQTDKQSEPAYLEQEKPVEEQQDESVDEQQDESVDEQQNESVDEQQIKGEELAYEEQDKDNADQDVIVQNFAQKSPAIVDLSQAIEEVLNN